MKHILVGLCLAGSLLAPVAPTASASEGAEWCHLSPWLQDLAPGIDRAGWRVELGAGWAFAQSLGAQEVQVYRRVGPVFEPVQVLAGPVVNAGLFGEAMLLHGGELFVSAPNTQVVEFGAGVVFVYGLEGGLWTLRQTLQSSTPVASQTFGRALAADGDWLAVGAPGQQDHVAVFRRVNGAWQHSSNLGSPLGKMGRALAVRASADGSYAHVLAGSNTADAPGKTSAGMVVPFRVDAQAAFHGPPLQPGNLAAYDEFGTSLAVDGQRLVVGAPRDKVLGHNVGAAWVFAVQDGDFFPQFAPIEVLRPQGEVILAEFGANLTLAVLPSGATRLVVGARGGASGEVAKGGALYTFRREPGQLGFASEARLTRAGGGAADLLGRSLAAHGDLILAGAPNAHELEGEVVLFSMQSASLPGGLAPADFLATAMAYGPSGGAQLLLTAAQGPIPGESSIVHLSGAAPGSLGCLAWGSTPAELPFFSSTLLLADPALLFLGPLGPQGQTAFAFQTPKDPSLHGANLLLQGFAVPPQGTLETITASNGLALWVGF